MRIGHYFRHYKAVDDVDIVYTEPTLYLRGCLRCRHIINTESHVVVRELLAHYRTQVTYHQLVQYVHSHVLQEVALVNLLHLSCTPRQTL